jgi:hypothetical protein
MAGIDQVRLLLKELGPALELGEIFEQPGGAGWGLVTQDGVPMYLDYKDDDDRLWLSGEVSTPRPEDRAGLYPLMLQYNAQWQKTGGVRLALDGPDGAVVLAHDVPVAGLDLPRLCAVIGNLQDMINGWRKVIAATDRPEAAASPAAIIRG